MQHQETALHGIYVGGCCGSHTAIVLPRLHSLLLSWGKGVGRNKLALRPLRGCWVSLHCCQMGHDTTKEKQVWPQVALLLDPQHS